MSEGLDSVAGRRICRDKHACVWGTACSIPEAGVDKEQRKLKDLQGWGRDREEVRENLGAQPGKAKLLLCVLMSTLTLQLCT